MSWTLQMKFTCMTCQADIGVAPSATAEIINAITEHLTQNTDHEVRSPRFVLVESPEEEE